MNNPPKRASQMHLAACVCLSTDRADSKCISDSPQLFLFVAAFRMCFQLHAHTKQAVVIRRLIDHVNFLRAASSKLCLEVLEVNAPILLEKSCRELGHPDLRSNLSA